MSTNTQYVVASLVNKMTNADSDIRYMATNDLIIELEKPAFVVDDVSGKKLISGLVNLLSDVNVEVQNMAVQCVGPLTRNISQGLLGDFTSQLYKLDTEVSQLALKMLIENAENQTVLGSLCNTLLADPGKNITLLSQLLKKHRPSTSIFDKLLPLLDDGNLRIRKTAAVALATLNKDYPKIVTQVLKQSKYPRTCIQTLQTLCNAHPSLFKQHIQSVYPLVNKYQTSDPELQDITCSALETFVLKCPVEMSQYANEIAESACELITYDPNYNEDMDMDDDDDEDDDEDSDEDEYSDADDVSWKVRKASSKLLAAIITTLPDKLEGLLQSAGPILINRFNEREENVRLDVLGTFIAMIKVTGATSKDQCKALLSNLVPSISKRMSKQLTSKSIQTKQLCFELLKELALAINGGLEFDSFIGPIEACLSTKDANSSSSNLKIEVLSFLRVAFKYHESKTFAKYVDLILPAIIQSCDEKYYKTVVESLSTLDAIIRIVSEKRHLDSIYTSLLGRLKTEADLEVKEKSLYALGTLISTHQENLTHSQDIYDVFSDRVKNELTKQVAMSVILQVGTKSSFDLTPIIEPIWTESITSLKKSNRQLRILALKLITTLVQKYKVPDPLADVVPLLSEVDLHIVPLVVELIESVIVSTKGACVNYVCENILGKLNTIVLESPHLVTGTSLVSLYSSVAKYGGAKCVDSSVKEMRQAAVNAKESQLYKTSFPILAQCVVAMVMEVEELRDSVLREFFAVVKNAGENFDTYFALLAIGEMGRLMNVDQLCGGVDATLFELLESSSHDIKHSAAVSLGNVALGNLATYMPMLLQAVKQGGKKVYHIFIALREIISKGGPNSEALNKYAPDIWQLLFQNVVVGDSTTEQTAEVEEGTRNLIAECLGKLTVTNPDKFLPELTKHLTDEARGIVVAAVRFTFLNGSVNFDNLLSTVIVDFLKLIGDDDLAVRKAALATMNNAAYQKPHLVKSSLDTLLPLLYKETNVRPELIHIVEMGPFKHTVDDGLETRKYAYDCMNTLLDTCVSSIDLEMLMSRVVAGLSDSASEITILSHLTLQKLVMMSPHSVQYNLDSIVEPLKKTITHESKENAVKQEKEKNIELVRSAVKTVVVIKLGLEGGSSKGAGRHSGGLASSTGAFGSNSGLSSVGSATTNSAAFDELYKSMQQSSISNVSEIYKVVTAEIESQILESSGRPTPMEF